MKATLSMLMFGVSLFAGVANGAPLSVCMDADSAPFSYKLGSRTGGTDVTIVSELARRLGQSLVIVWFEIEDDEEAVRSRQINALLSGGYCELVSGYPFLSSQLVAPAVLASQLPELASESGPRYPPGTTFKYVPLVWTQPYFAVRWGFAGKTGSDALAIRTPADALAFRLSAAANSLASGFLIQNFGSPAMLATRHSNSPHESLAMVAEGHADLAVVERHHLDRYVWRKPGQGLTWTGVEFRLTVDFVMIGEQGNTRFKRYAQTLATMLEDGAIAAAFAAAGVHHYKPVNQFPLATEVLLEQMML